MTLFRPLIFTLMLFGLALGTVLFASRAVSQEEDRAARILERRDANGDGRITSEEWGERRRRNFTRLDTDGDGVITTEELRARFGGGGSAENGSRRENPGRGRADASPSGPPLDGQVGQDTLDEETRCGIGRSRKCDLADAIKRGLFETGLRPVFPEGFACRDIDEQWAIDYTYKRDREARHGGIDMPAPYDTPIIAVADGTVVAKFEGANSMRGREIILRHSPSDTGLPVWVYTGYAHFNALPSHNIGQRVRKGEILGPTGNSGRQGRRERRPAIHFAAWFSTDPRYVAGPRAIIPVDGSWMDPNALYRGRQPFDSASMKNLPDDHKSVKVAIMTRDGAVVPAGARVVWPYFCKRD